MEETGNTNAVDDKILVPASTNVEKRGTVIMLHGWAQNEVVFRNRTKQLTKKLNQAGFDCLFLRGPILLPPLTGSIQATDTSKEWSSSLETKTRENKQSLRHTTGRDSARAWFLYDSEDPSNRSLSQTDQELHYAGLDDSIRLLKDELQILHDESVNEAVYYILGFSQGAVFGHIVSSLVSYMPEDPAWSKIQKCVLMSGFPATPKDYPTGRLCRLSVPSLHVIGSTDTRVPSALSHALAASFVDATILIHDKGHAVPQQSARCAVIVGFLGTR